MKVRCFNMRLGMLCYATDSGLGIQTRALYKWLQPDKVMLVDISSINRMPIHEEWYDYDIRTRGFPTNQQIDDFLKGLDVVFVCENPLNYYLFEKARELGVKTIQQPNYEFFEYVFKPDLPRPDVLALPSRWSEEAIRATRLFERIEYIPLPVDTEGLPLKNIIEAKTFFHVAGRIASHDRNGTMTYINAVRRMPRNMNARFLLYCQTPTPEIRSFVRNIPRLELIESVPEPGMLYEQGDIMVLPRRYGGLCLPLNEAIGCGIPTLTPNIDPNNKWLPEEWLVPVFARHRVFRVKSDVKVYDTDPVSLAKRMIHLYLNPEKVRLMHKQALGLREELCWDSMKPKYEEFIENVCRVEAVV